MEGGRSRKARSVVSPPHLPTPETGLSARCPLLPRNGQRLGRSAELRPIHCPAACRIEDYAHALKDAGDKAINIDLQINIDNVEAGNSAECTNCMRLDAQDAASPHKIPESFRQTLCTRDLILEPGT
jgi:hypothetical protein